MPALGQEVPEPIEVPPAGYEATDTIPFDDPWKYYVIHVGAGQELTYEFQVIGEGNISVYLSPRDDPLNYLVSFSSPQAVTSFSRTFPPDYGFAREYFIQVNSTAGIDVEYTVSIHTRDVATDYTLQYILLIVGFVALVIFSYKLVLWQEKNEKEARKKKRRGKRGK
jgi:hypothetical protein